MQLQPRREAAGAHKQRLQRLCTVQHLSATSAKRYRPHAALQQRKSWV